MNYSKGYNNDLLRSTKKFLEDIVIQKPVIVAVYLFGSFVREKSRRGSDVDLAFLFERSFYKNDPYKTFMVAQIIGAELGEVIGKAVDISILNKASLVFSYEVISTGVCVYEKDYKERILYEIAIKGQYYDFKPFITKLRRKKMEYICEVAERHVR
ncbi:MAG: type VII toxin-antitoxin system MntA family adenylyltransferase antitoxin [Thermodesulfovibrionales bacterium]